MPGCSSSPCHPAGDFNPAGLPPSLPCPIHSRGSSELKPSDIQTRFSPGVFLGAPYRLPLRAPRHTSDLSAMRHGIPRPSTQALYPIPRLLGFLPIDCDQGEIIEEIYQQNIRAADRDALHAGSTDLSDLS